MRRLVNKIGDVTHVFLFYGVGVCGVSIVMVMVGVVLVVVVVGITWTSIIVTCLMWLISGIAV